MEIIVPAAGLSTRFPGMKPKYLLYDYKGELMIKNALASFLDRYQITIGILKQHDIDYSASEFLKYEFGDSVQTVILDNPTRGPADTVYQILEKAGIENESILIKDCDSFFDHEVISGNYICVSNISEHEVLKKIASKSFVITNENGIIINIVEKQIVSDTFCVGGYKFESAEVYRKTFQQLSSSREIFVSDVIGKCIADKHVFTKQSVSNYVDVGTAQDWFEFNDKPVIFCDIDGTLIRNQNRAGLNNYNDEPIILQSNVDVILKYQQQGSQIIFTTSRPKVYESRTREVLNNLGFKNYQLIIGLLNSRRILINDYNNSNPYPRAEAINIERNTDSLNQYFK